MNRTYIILVASIAVVALGAVSYAAYDYSRPVRVPEVAISTPEAVVPEAVRDYSLVTLRIGETAVFEGLRLTPRAVVDDSRCPSDVRCVWAGTAHVELEVVSGLGTSTSVLELGKSMTTEAQEVAFTALTPATKAGVAVPENEYRIQLDVSKRAAAPAPVQGGCYVGGCSSQICSDQPDMASTCEYRESYACYQNATCERQQSGECGWTQTPALSACLTAAR